MKKGFTLAEVLITIGIIGVVAALTMGMLIPELEKITTAAKLKKFYNVISQATDKAMLEHGDWRYWDYTLNANHFFKKYYKDQLEVMRIACKYSNTDFFECRKVDDEILNSVYIFLKDGTCASFSKNTANSNYNAIKAFGWAINTSCFKTRIQGRNDFQLALYNFKNMKYRCNYTPMMCGFSGDNAYVGDLPQYSGREPDEGSCNDKTGSASWESYTCYYKFIQDGMKFSKDYYFFKRR